MIKCPNSSHSAGLNACKSRAAINIKRRSVKLSSFHSGLLSLSYSSVFSTCYTKYTVCCTDFCTYDTSSHSSSTETFLVNFIIHVLKLSWHQNSINFSSADSHIKLLKPTDINLTKAISLCDNTSVYIYMYFFYVRHNNNIIKYTIVSANTFKSFWLHVSTALQPSSGQHIQIKCLQRAYSMGSHSVYNCTSVYNT